MSGKRLLIAWAGVSLVGISWALLTTLLASPMAEMAALLGLMVIGFTGCLIGMSWASTDS